MSYISPDFLNSFWEDAEKFKKEKTKRYFFSNKGIHCLPISTWTLVIEKKNRLYSYSIVSKDP